MEESRYATVWVYLSEPRTICEIAARAVAGLVGKHPPCTNSLMFMDTLLQPGDHEHVGIVIFFGRMLKPCGESLLAQAYPETLLSYYERFSGYQVH